jgi:hypothetical protein
MLGMRKKDYASQPALQFGLIVLMGTRFFCKEKFGVRIPVGPQRVLTERVGASLQN